MKKIQIKKAVSKNFKKHNHKLCYENSMKAFHKYCLEKNLKLTPLRLKVFELLLKDHRPIGAYQILDMLSKEGFSSTPPIAYRVLDFLIEQGFAHKIERFNTFIACSHPGTKHSPTFMICRKCDKVAEMCEKDSRLKIDKKTLSEFQIEESFIEIIGICKSCNQLETVKC